MGCITKLGLFILNFVIFAAGVAVVTLASIIIHKDNTYGTLLASGVFTLPIIILISGMAIVILGFLGCCGAMKENSCMLKTYAFVVIVMLLAEVTLGILLLVYPHKAEEAIKTHMNNTFADYGQDNATNKIVDSVQSDLECCGVTGYKDWENYEYGGADVSKGCCREDDTSNSCYKDVTHLSEEQANKRIYTRGCYGALKEDLQDEFIGLGVVLFIMAVIQVMAVSCACGLAKKSSHYA